MERVLYRVLSGFFFTAVLCVFFLLFSAQAAQPRDNQLTILSSNIKEELLNLKAESAIMRNDLDNTIALLLERSQDLKLSEDGRIQSQTELTALSSSFLNMSGRFNDSLTKAIQLEAKVKTRNRVLFWAGAVTLLNIAGKAVMLILWRKGVRVPRLLDILV